MRKIPLLLITIVAGCSALDSPTPTSTGHSGPPPGISYRFTGDDYSHATAQANDYCKTYDNKVAKLDAVKKAEGQSEGIATFSCN